MKINLTQAAIKKLPAHGADYYDTECDGLVLRVRDSGARSWRVNLGRGQWYTLGTVDDLPPAKARVLARAKRVEKASGGDPIAEKRKKRAATLADFLTDLYDPWAAAHLRTGAETGDRVRAVFKAFLSKPLPEIAPFALERWRTHRHRAGATPSTTNRDLDGLRSVLSKAVEWHTIEAHPMRSVKRAKLDVIGRLRYLTAAEEERLRQALDARETRRRVARASFNAWRAERGYVLVPDYPGPYTDHMQPIVLLALNTGLRRGELLGLLWADVDLTGAQLVVRGDEAKSGRTRYVPLNTEAVTVLRTWKPTDATPESWVFPGPTGEQMESLKTAWGRIAKAATLNDFTFHDLRHTFASKLVQAGVDLNTVRELLGHADLKMTLRYAHLAPQHKAAAVAKLVRA